MYFNLTSFEILRVHKNVTKSEICKRCNIDRLTYYNLIAGNNTSRQTLETIGKYFGISLVAATALYNLDSLSRCGISIKMIVIPEIFPIEVKSLILKEHPVFSFKSNQQKNDSQAHNEIPFSYSLHKI